MACQPKTRHHARVITARGDRFSQHLAAVNLDSADVAAEQEATRVAGGDGAEGQS